MIEVSEGIQGYQWFPVCQNNIWMKMLVLTYISLSLIRSQSFDWLATALMQVFPSFLVLSLYPLYLCILHSSFITYLNIRWFFFLISCCWDHHHSHTSWPVPIFKSVPIDLDNMMILTSDAVVWSVDSGRCSNHNVPREPCYYKLMYVSIRGSKFLSILSFQLSSARL